MVLCAFKDLQWHRRKSQTEQTYHTCWGIILRERQISDLKLLHLVLSNWLIQSVLSHTVQNTHCYSCQLPSRMKASKCFSKIFLPFSMICMASNVTEPLERTVFVLKTLVNIEFVLINVSYLNTFGDDLVFCYSFCSKFLVLCIHLEIIAAMNDVFCFLPVCWVFRKRSNSLWYSVLALYKVVGSE